MISWRCSVDRHSQIVTDLEVVPEQVPYVDAGLCLNRLEPFFGDDLVSDDVKADSFTLFVESTEQSLRQALTAAVGPELGREATAEALAYGWEHWDRVGDLENPAGYLYRVGRNLAKRMGGFEPRLAPATGRGEVWVEPGLPLALKRLSEKQRLAVSLVHGYGWSLSEAAGLLGVSKGTVQSYLDRGLKRLRRDLGVET